MPVSAATRIGRPIAVLGKVLPSASAAQGRTREVIVTVARATLGTKVYLESQPPGGPSERIPALAQPASNSTAERVYRALLPAAPPRAATTYVPLALTGDRELRGEPLRLALAKEGAWTEADAGLPSPSGEPSRAHQASARGDQAARSPDAPMSLPKMELLARVEAQLPKATSFGSAPDGFRIAFYIAEGRWAGPRIHARYRPEGGDWMLVRPDGVGIPNARATLETEDGALLYYQLTGSIDLGPNGYIRAANNDLPETAPLSVVAKVTTSSERWKWLNRLTVVGAGQVELKRGKVIYDIYSLEYDPAALRT